MRMILDFTVVDAETTGRSDKADDVTEISAIKYREGKAVASFSSLIKSKNTILPFVVELTGISNEMIADAPLIDDVIGELVDFIGDDIILGHDVNFDYGLIKEAYERVHESEFTNSKIDNLKLAQCLIKDSANHKLETLCEYFSIPREKGHRALDDCHQTAEVYLKILNKYKEEYYECL